MCIFVPKFLQIFFPFIGSVQDQLDVVYYVAQPHAELLRVERKLDIEKFNRKFDDDH